MGTSPFPIRMKTKRKGFVFLLFCVAVFFIGTLLIKTPIEESHIIFKVPDPTVPLKIKHPANVSMEIKKKQNISSISKQSELNNSKNQREIKAEDIFYRSFIANDSLINSPNYDPKLYGEIDVVILWVNGSDPRWRGKLKVYQKKYGINMSMIEIKDRFSDNGELLFCLRGIAKNLNWVRKIHIITDNQIPIFLNRSHPRIRLINHSEIMGDTVTFNSNAIQFNLDKLKGITERFLLMDDDIIITKPYYPTNFFTQDGKPVIKVSKNILEVNRENFDKYLKFRRLKGSKMEFSRYMYNILKAFNATFGEINLPQIEHVIFPLTKKQIKKVYNNTEVNLMRTKIFRSFNDLQFQTFVYGASIRYNLAKTVHSFEGESVGLFSNGAALRFMKKNPNYTNLPNLLLLNTNNKKMYTTYLPGLFPEKCEFENGYFVS